MKFIIRMRMKLGALIKSALPDNSIFRVIRGNLKGKKWYINSSNPGIILGLHDESELINLIEKVLDKNSVFYDIGANVGFFTLLASDVAINGQVISFEPLNRNLFYLKEHLRLNNIENVNIIEAAVSDSDGSTYFYKHNDSGNITGDIYEFGEIEPIEVNKVKLDNLIKVKNIYPPDLIKIDVDGGELLVLKGALLTIKEHRPKFFVETHSDELLKKCCNFLRNNDYDIQLLNIEGKNKKQIFAYPTI